MIWVILFVVLLLAAVLSFVMVIVKLAVWLVKGCKSISRGKLFMKIRWNGLVFGGSVLIMGILIGISQAAASTPLIKDENGRELKGSIAELTEVTLNGRKEWISIRGRDSRNPILLFLAGGPGGSQLAAVRHDLSRLEEHFVVVGWEQPGSGKSYNAINRDSLTPEIYVEDGNALTQYLLSRFSRDKIYLAGESWGSALGIFLAGKYPQDYYAFIGTGQMVDFLETEKQDYDKALEIAVSRNDTDKVKKLQENGKPPYFGEEVTWKSAEYLNYLSAYMASNPAIQNNGYNTFRDLFSPEYGLIDKLNYIRGIINTFNHVYPQLYEIDLREDYRKMEVPVYFFLGRHDINAPVELVEEYYDLLQAPLKEIVWFEHSGHSPWINEGDKFVEELVKIKEIQ